MGTTGPEHGEDVVEVRGGIITTRVKIEGIIMELVAPQGLIMETWKKTYIGRKKQVRWRLKQIGVVRIRKMDKGCRGWPALHTLSSAGAEC